MKWLILIVIILAFPIIGGSYLVIKKEKDCISMQQNVTLYKSVNLINNFSDTVRLQYLTVKEFKNKLGYYESRGRYNITNRIGMKGKYQFSPYMIKRFGKVKPKDFLLRPKIQEQAMSDACRYYLDYIYKKEYNKYIGEEIDGVVITLEGLMLGMHFCPSYLNSWLKSDGDINIGDGDITIRDYMKKFENRGIVTTSRVVYCNTI